MNSYLDYDPQDAPEPEGAELASMNLEAQVRLIDELREARELSGRTVNDVAALLKVDPDLVRAVEQHERSLTLRELRLIAHASDAFVSYTVVPNLSDSLQPEPEVPLREVYAKHWYPIEAEPIDDVASRLLASSSA